MLRRQITKMLFNATTSDTVHALTGGGYNIKGYGPITASQISSCTYALANAGVAQVSTVTVAIPTTCECPYVWELTTLCQPSQEDGTNYEINNTFSVRRLYQYEDPAGGTPTVEATANAIGAMINNDPNACVTAAYHAINVGVPVGDIEFTAKTIGKPFQLYTPSGTVAYTGGSNHVGVTATMSDNWMAKQFPIQVGAFGSQPTIAIPGVTYALYRLVLTTSIQDISAANHYNDYQAEVEFYVNTASSSYAAWVTAFHALSATCFVAP